MNFSVTLFLIIRYQLTEVKYETTQRFAIQQGKRSPCFMTALPIPCLFLIGRTQDSMTVIGFFCRLPALE